MSPIVTPLPPSGVGVVSAITSVDGTVTVAGSAVVPDLSVTYPQSSFLTASYADLAGNASGALARPSFTLVASAGADVAIQVADPTKLDFATTGLYQLWITTSLQPDAANLTLELIDFSVAGVSILGAGLYVLPVVTGSAVQAVVSTPPITIAAGTSVQGMFSCSTSAGTWSAFAIGPGVPDVWVYRLA